MPKIKKEQPKRKIVGRFRVLRGTHHEGGRHYGVGDIVESASDLTKHNVVGSTKFAKADEVIVDQPESVDDEDNADAFEEMTVAELRQWAEEGDINLTGCVTKAEIIERLTKAE